jgi:hypothetical protein
VLKPAEMLANNPSVGVPRRQASSIMLAAADDSVGETEYWPPLRETLHRTTLHVISLHNLPKASPIRGCIPHLAPIPYCARGHGHGVLRESATHQAECRLVVWFVLFSGASSGLASLAAVVRVTVTTGSLVVLLLRPTSCLRAPPRSGSYFIRLEESLACPKYCCKSNRTASLAHRSFDCCTGFCAACTELRPKASHVFGIRSEVSIAPKANGGMSAAIGATVHCVAVEPHATFVRVSIQDNGQEVAYETAVLGRLRFGYRVFLLRSSFGTRIELAYLFVCITFGDEVNIWQFAQRPQVCGERQRDSFAFRCFSIPLYLRTRNRTQPQASLHLSLHAAGKVPVASTTIHLGARRKHARDDCRAFQAHGREHVAQTRASSLEAKSSRHPKWHLTPDARFANANRLRIC